MNKTDKKPTAMCLNLCKPNKAFFGFFVCPKPSVITLIISFFLVNLGVSAQSFITTWRTATDNESITIPTVGGQIYNYTVDWGDGTPITTHTTAVSPDHIYAIAGDYQVSISGLFLK